MSLNHDGELEVLALYSNVGSLRDAVSLVGKHYKLSPEAREEYRVGSAEPLVVYFLLPHSSEELAVRTVGFYTPGTRGVQVFGESRPYYRRPPSMPKNIAPYVLNPTQVHFALVP